MGFTGGGLGRHRDGIANPIAVQKRQGKQGIQDDGEMVDQEGACEGEEGGRLEQRSLWGGGGGRGGWEGLCSGIYIYIYS